MKFQFTIQQYQTEAVKSTVDVFDGQPFRNSIAFTQEFSDLPLSNLGLKNADLALDSEDLINNIRSIQKQNSLKISEKLIPSQGLGACVLDVEMETGTGKTYVYIKTMFELNKRYGWNKFMVIVPTVAIREGVYKSFQMLEDHFMEQYGKKARYFVYTSKQLNKIADFANNSALSVMIINMQAFSSSLKPDGTQKDAKIMNTPLDSFGGRRPREVIADTRPILILDEPQKLEGAATLNGMKQFTPLFAINYSATHKTKHNQIYALDAVDAFQQKLVKRIEVKGFEFRNNLGTSRFIALENIQPDPAGPIAWIEHDSRSGTGIKQVRSKLRLGDSLFVQSKELREYEGYVISDIDAVQGFVEFQNGERLYEGDVSGDINTDTLQRVQIAETIRSHFDKERILFSQGIKTLSLFFIDEVKNYREYDEHGNPKKAKFQQWFEEEYEAALNDTLQKLDTSLPADNAYAKYLSDITAASTHKGYFSIDKKGHCINSKAKKDGGSDDVDAYTLILKDKERLLSFGEPTRFIFSHSALQEGWDNPNIFQICTLRSTASVIKKRQEIGRGLRLCVNQQGYRQDQTILKDQVQTVNVLTVIANENYSKFVSELQNETRETLRDRPEKITVEFLTGKVLRLDNGQEIMLTKEMAKPCITYLEYNDYIDDEGRITDTYKAAHSSQQFAPFQKSAALDPVRDFFGCFHKNLCSLFDASLDTGDWVTNGRIKKACNNLNPANFGKKEFQELWHQINTKFSYTVQYDSDELIRNAIKSLNEKLFVSLPSYRRVIGKQINADEFEEIKTKEAAKALPISATSVKYDLIGEIARGAVLTRKTASAILQGITAEKFAFYKQNPEEFIANCVGLIRDAKATMIVEHICYHPTEQRYESSIFTLEKPLVDPKLKEAVKHVTKYVVTDSEVEQKFSDELELAEEVSVYAKLPRAFQIPTPVGNYAPDWAIAFKKGSFKHIFFVAETKGTMNTMELKEVEKAKIECATKLFEEARHTNESDVRYYHVTTYKDLLDRIRGIN